MTFPPISFVCLFVCLALQLSQNILNAILALAHNPTSSHQCATTCESEQIEFTLTNPSKKSRDQLYRLLGAVIKQLCTPGVPQSVLPPKPIAPDAFEDEHSSEGLRGRILYVQIHTWWHLSARMLDSESELWTEDAPGWRSEDSRTAVKLCFHKSSAAQFPTNPTEFILTNPLICVLRSLHLESDILSPRCHRV